MSLTLQLKTKRIKSLHFFFFGFVFCNAIMLLQAQRAYALALSLKQSDSKTDSKIKKEKILYGATKTGQDMYAYRVFKEGRNIPMRPAVIITGGIHGNEHMGLVSGMVEKLNDHEEGFKEFFEAGGVAYLIPELNPGGVASRNRYNPQGVDLNRDFKMDRRPSQSESSKLLDFLETDLETFGARPILAMDYHCCSKSLIYPEIDGDDVFYKQQFEKIVGLMKEHVDSEYKSGLTKDIFGYETHGTLKGYWFKKYGALSFTYEGSTPGEEIKKLSGHHQWWKKILGVVVDIYDNKLAMLRPQIEQKEVSGESPAYYTE